MISFSDFSKILPLTSFLEQEDLYIKIYESFSSENKQLPFEYNSFLNNITEKLLPSYLILFSLKKEDFTEVDLKNRLKDIVEFFEPQAVFKSSKRSNSILCHYNNSFLGIIKIKETSNQYKAVIYISPEKFLDKNLPDGEEDTIKTMEKDNNLLEENLLKKIKEMFLNA